MRRTAITYQGGLCNRPLLTHHVAKLAGVTPRAIIKAVQANKLKAFKVGARRWSYMRGDVDAFLAMRKSG